MPSVSGLARLDGSQVLGLADIHAKLQEIPGRIARNVVRRSLNAGAVIVRDEARRIVPVRFGALKKAIASRTNNRRSTPTRYFSEVYIANRAFTVSTVTGKDGNARVRVKSEKRKKGDSVKGKVYPRNYAHLVEFGTAPHAIGRGSKINPKKGSVIQHGRLHPGARAHPFIRPAYRGKGQAALDRIKATLRTELNIELAKLGQRRLAG